MTDIIVVREHTDPYISTENETVSKEEVKFSLLEKKSSIKAMDEGRKASITRVMSKSDTSGYKPDEIYQNRLYPSFSCQIKKALIDVQPILKTTIKDKKVVKNDKLASHVRKDLFGNEIREGTKSYRISFKQEIADVKEVESYKEYNAEDQEEPCICEVF